MDFDITCPRERTFPCFRGFKSGVRTGLRPSCPEMSTGDLARFTSGVFVSLLNASGLYFDLFGFDLFCFGQSKFQHPILKNGLGFFALYLNRYG